MNTSFEAEILLVHNKGPIEGLAIGQPSFFVGTPTGVELFEEPTLFLHSEFVRNGSSLSIHTWRSAAYSLKVWFEWLQAIRKAWREADRQDWIDFKDAYQVAISPKTGQAYDPSTISSRMQIVGRFYEFCKVHGWYEGNLGTAMDIHQGTRYQQIDRDPLAHIRSGGRTKRRDRDLPRVRAKVVIHPFQTSDLYRLISYCGPRAAQRDGDSRPARDRLFVDMGWVVGLRVEEIRSLTTLQFLSLHPNPKAPLVSHPLVIKGKGGKVRQVAIPGWLVEDAISYILGERADALEKGRISSRSATTQLFIGGSTSKRPGLPISTRRLQQVIEEACLAVGLTKIVEVADPDSGERKQILRQKHSVHDLRHTAAVLIYHAERRSGNSEPWKVVQTQLGHAQLQTTLDIYLHHVEIFGDKQKLYDVRTLIGLK